MKKKNGTRKNTDIADFENGFYLTFGKMIFKT